MVAAAKIDPLYSGSEITKNASLLKQELSPDHRNPARREYGSEGHRVNPKVPDFSEMLHPTVLLSYPYGFPEHRDHRYHVLPE